MFDGRVIQVGLTSHGTSSDVMNTLGFHCSTFEPAMYTKVSSFIDFIDDVINEFTNSNQNAIMESICEPGKPCTFQEWTKEPPK